VSHFEEGFGLQAGGAQATAFLGLGCIQDYPTSGILNRNAFLFQILESLLGLVQFF
jgi:hypothetical protein